MFQTWGDNLVVKVFITQAQRSEFILQNACKEVRHDVLCLESQLETGGFLGTPLPASLPYMECYSQ